MVFVVCFSFYGGLTQFAIVVVSPVVIYVITWCFGFFPCVIYCFFNVFLAKLILVFVVVFCYVWRCVGSAVLSTYFVVWSQLFWRLTDIC